MVHVWDSETLLKLQEIGLGAFERGVGALAFSVVVSWPEASRPPSFLSGDPLLALHQEVSDILACLSLARPVLLREGRVSASPSLPTCDGVCCLVTVNSQTSGPHSAPPACPHPQDQGAFLCVVDDSNEHMLSVWDCSRGTKLAEIKVGGPRGLQAPPAGRWEWWARESRLTVCHFLSGCRRGQPPASVRLRSGDCGSLTSQETTSGRRGTNQ